MSPLHLTALPPTTELLRLIAKVLELEPNDPAVVAAFDHLVPFVPGWWELIRWSKAEKIARG